MSERVMFSVAYTLGSTYLMILSKSLIIVGRNYHYEEQWTSHYHARIVLVNIGACNYYGNQLHAIWGYERWES